MGIRASKPPPKPNPYAARRDDAPEYSGLPQTTGHPQTPPSPAKLDKSFGLSRKFANMFELVEEVRQGHFRYSHSAIAKKGELKGEKVAVRVIPKFKMTTAVAVEDVRREVKILRGLKRQPNLAQFYGAFEDADNVYIVMELCEGGVLLDRILTRGVKYSEDFAKEVIVQIMNVVAFCHLHGIMHRDIKPENFLFASDGENSQLKAIDFQLSHFVRPDQKVNDNVGGSYYVAPEVLSGSYGTEADVWSIGVIAYILLCGNRPFWARTEPDIFQAVMKAKMCFDENPWPSLSSESKDFVKSLLDEDPSRRITAAQALCHPWLRNHNKVKLPIDIVVFRLMKGYMQSSSLRKAALRALSKTLTEDELFYLKEQFTLMCPDESGGITLDTMKMALIKDAIDANDQSHFLEFLDPLKALQYRRMFFAEFGAAAINVHQLELSDNWDQRTLHAYEIFEKDGNRVIAIQELASELGVGPSMPVHVLQEWIRHSDGKLTVVGFVKLLQRYSESKNHVLV